MTRIYLLDTNTVSYIVKGRSPMARARLATLGEGIAAISSITEAELLYGLARFPQLKALDSALPAFLGKIQVMSWGREEAAAYGKLRAKQEAPGKTLGNLDMLIAAHAVATGAILVTSDAAFGQVADIRQIENWATDISGR